MRLSIAGLASIIPSSGANSLGNSPQRLPLHPTPTASISLILATLISPLAAAVLGRACTTFTEVLIGPAVTKGGNVTDARLAVGLSWPWTSIALLLQRGRWFSLRVWEALLSALTGLFAPPVWHVIINDTVGLITASGAKHYRSSRCRDVGVHYWRIGVIRSTT
ncbi:hypothetical protein [Azospirillum canadense]|uniref:hypothetical protein n=1 Tax=Azospirillum canadense TaxID=403962 RepID=UPI002226AE06|nr:hypothetical protein [Azospirillum canadense]MCW2240785.1 hypothetical protein [Azospirillum canadense]